MKKEDIIWVAYVGAVCGFLLARVVIRDSSPAYIPPDPILQEVRKERFEKGRREAEDDFIDRIVKRLQEVTPVG